jgi:N-methylhydantoinase A
VAPEPHSRRRVWFEGEGVDTPVYDREALPCGFKFSGPAIIEQLDSTTVLPPGASAEVDKYLNIVIRVKE